MKNTINGVTEVIDIEGATNAVGFSDGSLEQGFVWCQNCGAVYHKNDGRWGSKQCKHCGQKLDWSAVEK